MSVSTNTVTLVPHVEADNNPQLAGNVNFDLTNWSVEARISRPSGLLVLPGTVGLTGPTLSEFKINAFADADLEAGTYPFSYRLTAPSSGPVETFPKGGDQFLLVVAPKIV